MTEWTCCGRSFRSSDPESALRALAKHLEEEHDIPREASVNWLEADAHVRDQRLAKRQRGEL